MRVHIVVREVLREHHLAEDVGVQVGGGLVAQKLVAQRLVAHADPADAHARRHDLGEGAQHAGLLAQLRTEAVGGGAGETQLAIGVVLEQEDVGALEDLHHLVMHVLRIAQARGVLEVGDHIDKLRVGVGRNSRSQLLAVKTVGIDGDGDDHRVKHMEGLQCHQIGGVLDQHLVARVDQRGANHGQGLLGAVGDNDILRLDAVDAHRLIALGDPGAQRGPAGGGAVLQRGHAVLLQHLFGGGLHLGDGEGDGVGKPAGKGDDVGRGGSGQNTGGELPLEVRLENALR